MFKRIINSLTVMALLCGCAEGSQDLKGSISITPSNGGESEKLLPGSPIVFKVQVRNTGTQKSSPGSLFIRYAYPEPLDQQKGSILYTSETEPMPELAPGESTTIAFSTPHRLPTLYEFIRNDWAMRKYEAIFQNGKDVIIADLPLTFSAYYYTGPGTSKL